MKSRNIIHFIRVVYAVVIGAVLVTAVLVIDSAEKFSEAQSEWENYNTEAVSKGFHLAQIRRAFGYGGLIHNFKNLVLRQDLALADSIAGDFKIVQTTIGKFRVLSSDPEEHEALNHIADTLENYEGNIGVVAALIAEGKTPQGIDAVVRVDDTGALAALSLLESNWLQAGVRAGNSSAVVLSEAEREIKLAFGAIVVALVIGIVLLVMARRETITRNRFEAALRASEERLTEAHRIAQLSHWELDAVTWRFKTFGHRFSTLGFDVADTGHGFEDLLDALHPDDRERIRREFSESVANGTQYDQTYRVAGPDGDITYSHAIGEILRDDSGAVIGMQGTTQDVTALRQAEEKLRQAQKMESVGQLSAGVAHDFNNMLAVVLGNIELLGERISGDLDARDMLETALSAGKKGAELTTRLLAYSKRQTLFPETLELEPVLAEVFVLIEQTIGKEINVSYTAGEELRDVHVDRSQLEAALVNLALNARDAMPEGGNLTVECVNTVVDESYLAANPNAVLGDYVILTVSDTGCGMDHDTLKKALDPFFTTKEVGKGSGLGLSMVYGFTEQSGGHLELESAPGFGTKVKLYLPASKTADVISIEDQAADPNRQGDGCAILVVDDDPGVREVVAMQLQSLGYEAVSAANAEEALSILDSGASVALLLTDVVLGRGMNGVALALDAKQRHPHLKVLCMSGHAETEIFERYDGANQLRLIAKPFSRSTLSELIEDTLSTDQHIAVG